MKKLLFLIFVMFLFSCEDNTIPTDTYCWTCETAVWTQTFQCGDVIDATYTTVNEDKCDMTIIAIIFYEYENSSTNTIMDAVPCADSGKDSKVVCETTTTCKRIK